MRSAMARPRAWIFLEKQTETWNLPHGCPTCPASAAIGYSISVTPLQMAAVYATIANDGVWIQPRLVTDIIDGDGQRVLVESGSHRVVSEGTARTMRIMLQAVVEDGTGTLASIDGYAVGGKTGTTRKFDFSAGSYTEGRRRELYRYGSDRGPAAGDRRGHRLSVGGSHRWYRRGSGVCRGHAQGSPPDGGELPMSPESTVGSIARQTGGALHGDGSSDAH